MAIRIKIAQLPRELEDAYQLRYQVCVKEEGHLDGARFPDGVVMDSFDHMDRVANVVAYNESGAIGTLRIHLDSGQGKPTDGQKQIADICRDLTTSLSRKHGVRPVIGIVSMLAVLRSWRHRRDVVRAMFKLAAGIAHGWGCTQLLAASSAKSAGLFGRIGFEELNEPCRFEHLGVLFDPMVCEFSRFHDWAFGPVADGLKPLKFFSDRFQRLILAPGEVVFREGDSDGEAYIVDSGAIRISKGDSSGEALTLATLGCGQMFGELSLIDAQPRSAQATALGMTELIALEREEFFKTLEDQPHRIRDILRIFSERLRRVDELAFVLAHGTTNQRIDHALSDIRKLAAPDEKRPDTAIARISPAELARQAGVGEAEVQGYLEAEKRSHTLEFNTRRIRFLKAS